MHLAISLATRGRPYRVVETINRSIANWTNPNTVMWVMCDNDDPKTVELAGRWGDRVRFSSMSREDTIAEKWNRIVKHEPNAHLYLVAADDDPYITPGYDQKLLDASMVFPDQIGMVYGHMANASFSGVVAPTRRLVELMDDKIFPEYFPYWFVDHWTDDVARLIGRLAFADVRTDQSNPGKTQEMREPGWWGTYFDALYLVRRRQAHAIINHPSFDSPPWLKQLLLTHHPLIEYRSRWINESLRAQNSQMMQWSGLTNTDERYLRKKSEAVALLPSILAEMPEVERISFETILLPKTQVPSTLVPLVPVAVAQ